MTLKQRTALLLALVLLGLAVAFATLTQMRAQEAARTQRSEAAEEKRWQAVAPGRVEPASGEIKLVAPVIGVIGQVLVSANDTAFAGEPLIRLVDNEAQARLATAEAQVGLRRRIRNDESASSRAATRRRAEDAVADAERAVVDAQAAVDRSAVDRRAGRASAADLDGARTALARAQDRLKQQKAELRRVETDTNTLLPSQAEGQLNVARSELTAAQAAVEKLTIRAPIAGTVLQVNAKPGELANPAAGQPLILLGDVSSLRVRAELDEHDFGEIKIGQSALVRPVAFRGREFAGKVSFIAPLVEPGRINARGQRQVTDVDVVEVLVDLAEPESLAVGMKVDVYFRPDTPQH
ncbi:MAG TPA: efflux RND transporter periplasmic adaptor subunit [Xanthobacteraceae bacterium]|jgi:HlyD family secretion protein